MAREIAINVYVFIFRILFNVCRKFPLRRKTTFVASFGCNVFYTAQELRGRNENEHIVILKMPRCKFDFDSSLNQKMLALKTINMVTWLRAIYHIATSRTIFVDNYYAFLAVTNFKPEVTCIQLWHAAGAIKQFGLQDLSIQNRPDAAYTRFKRVYKRFDYVVVGSDKMGVIFQEGFGVKKQQLLKTGVPRTDFFFQRDAMLDATIQFKNKYPDVNDKKVILYAPTYRDGMLHTSNLHLNVDKMCAALKDDYVLFIRMHPAVHMDTIKHYPGFMYNVSDEIHFTQLLVGADILITDYSSIPFEFSLLRKPMVFYAYDLDAYAHTRGFWELYEDVVPGPIVETTDEIITVIKKGPVDMNRIESFAHSWNQYSRGDASEKLISTLYPEYK